MMFFKLLFSLLIFIHAEILYAQSDASIFIPRSSPFWNSVTDFSVSAAKDIGLKLTVYNAKNSTEKLLEQVQQAVDAKTQSILFINYGGIGESILKIAEQHKIPSILINTKLNNRSLKPRVDYKYWIGSITPEIKKLNSKEKLGIGGPFFDGAQGVIMMYDYLNGFDFSDESLSFSNSMMVSKREQLYLLKSILEAPQIINYKSLSKAHTPQLFQYQFNPAYIALKAKLNIIDQKWVSVPKATSEAKNINFTEEENEWLKQHENIKIGVMDSWPPISHLNTESGELEGIDIDIIHEINKHLNHPLKILPASWDVIYSNAKEKKLDAIMGITPKEFRKEFFNFTTPYLSVPHIIVTQASNESFLSNEQDLSHKTLALEKSFINVKYFKNNYPKVTIKTYENTLEALEAVSRGDADAYAGSRIVVLYLIDKHLLSNLKIHGKLSKKATDNAIGVRKNAPILHGILQKILNNIGESGLQDIKDRWLRLKVIDKSKRPTVNLTPQEKTWIKQHKNIDIGIDGNWPPIDFMDENNQFHGITADYLKEIGLMVGLNFIPHKSNTFKEMLNKVMSGELKAGASISYKKQREERLFFSTAFFHVQKVIIAKKEIDSIHDIKSLYGKKVAVEDGFLTMAQLQERHPEIKLIPMKSTIDALKAVSFGEVDAYVGNQAVAAWLSQKNQLSNLTVKGDSELGSGPQNFAVSKTAPDWVPLISIFDKALASISAERKFEIENRWLGQAEENPNKVPRLNLTKKETKWLQEHKEITLGVDAAWRPLEFINSEGEYRGVSAEFMTYFGQQLGIKFITPKKLTWLGVIEKLKSKELDIAPLLTHTDERSKFLSFTKSYLDFPAVIFNRKGHVLLNGLPDLIGKKLGVVNGYAISELIKRDYPDIQQVFMSSTEEGLRALSTGKVDAYIDMLAVGGYQMVSAGLSNLQVAASVPYMDGNQFRIGVRNDWPELVSILNKAIDQLPEEKKNAILKKWLVIEFQQKIDYTLLFWVLGIASLIFMALSLHAREMRKINSKLQDANKAVEKSNQFKSQFLANMSHEIRTPMNAIVGIGHLLSSTLLNEKQQNYLNTLQKSSQTLLGLIDDILDFSKIESGHLNIESIDFNLEKLLCDLSDITLHKITHKKLEFIYKLSDDVPLHLKGDPFRISQILINLVSNAIKFTEQGHVILKIHTIKSLDDKVWLQFEVTDTGIGINSDKLEKLFTPFEQEDNSTTRKYGGTGLGLSISHQLTKLMGGAIGAESIKGVGSRFFFNIPFEKMSSKEKIIHMPEPNLLGINVLLVDDNDQALEIISDMLASMSFKVSVASSGKDALHLLSKSDEVFDLILMDWRMPDMDGKESIQEIRRLMTDKMPLAIMMTAYGRDAVDHKIDELLLDGFLIKPITPSLLFDAIIQAKNNKQNPNLISEQTSQANSFVVGTLVGQILLVEDNLINQQIAQEILQQMGLDVWICNNGLEAINLLKQKQPDLILMDIQMPVMDGYEATRLIKKDLELQHIPIIAMTASAMAEDIKKSFEAGMQAHISKPVDPVILFKTLNRYLKKEEHSTIAKDSVQPNALFKWPDSMPGLDIKQGIKQVGGDEAFYQKLLNDFLNNHGDMVMLITQNIKKGEFEKAARETHTVKGVAGNIGAKRLQQSAMKLDAALKVNSDVSDYLLQDLADSCTELCGSLRILINTNEKSIAVNNDSKEQVNLDELLQALKLNDGQSFEFLQNVSVYLKAKVGLNHFNEIESLVEDFEYEDAATYLINALNES